MRIYIANSEANHELLKTVTPDADEFLNIHRKYISYSVFHNSYYYVNTAPNELIKHDEFAAVLLLPTVDAKVLFIRSIYEDRINKNGNI